MMDLSAGIFAASFDGFWGYSYYYFSRELKQA